MRRPLSVLSALVVTVLVLAGCTGGPLPEIPQLPQLPGAAGPKVTVADGAAPSDTRPAGSLRVDQIVREGSQVALGLTLAATGEMDVSRGSIRVITNTGLEMKTASGTESRKIPARSVATLAVQVPLPEEPVGQLTVTGPGKLSVTVDVPESDGAVVWRPAPLRQVGLTQEPRQTEQSNIVFDTIRSEGLVTEVTYHATAPDNKHLNVCAYNFQDDRCRVEVAGGAVLPLLGRTAQSTGTGGRQQGTLRFLGEIDPTVTNLTLHISASTSSSGDLDPVQVTLPTHADSPTLAAAGDLTREPLTLTTPVVASEPERGHHIEVTRVDVLADRVQLHTKIQTGSDNLLLGALGRTSHLRSSAGDAFPLLGVSNSLSIRRGTTVEAVLVFQGAVPASVTELHAQLGNLYGTGKYLEFTVPVPAVDPAPPAPEGTLGEVAAEAPEPTVTVTPAPAPEPTATPAAKDRALTVAFSDIQPLPVSRATVLANPGSLVLGSEAPPQDQNADAEARAQQSLKDLGAQRTPDGWVLTLPETVLFDYNKYDIKADADAKLTEVGALLQHFADAEIRVQGHTDSTGSAEGNATLSENRAQAVATALSGKGVAASRMTVEGFGPDRPVASNATSEGQAKNRRVEIVLREKD